MSVVPPSSLLSLLNRRENELFWFQGEVCSECSLAIDLFVCLFLNDLQFSKTWKRNPCADCKCCTVENV